jgi:hypothetical protein
MATVRALRGVCIGVNRHLKPEEIADIDDAQVTFLSAIGAVELMPDAPPVESPKAIEPPAKVGKKE